jgi:hypothetical protein
MSSDLTADQLALLRDRLDEIDMEAWPIDARIPNACTLLNDPTQGPAVQPVLKPVDLPTLVSEGLLRDDQIAGLMSNSLTIEFLRQLLHAHPHGATSVSKQVTDLIQAARVALIINGDQAAAILGRFDPVAVRAIDVAAGDPDARTTLETVSWAQYHLGRLVTGADIILAMEA